MAEVHDLDAFNRPAISLEGVCFGYGSDPRALLNGIDLEVLSGTCAGLQGGNGTGKSTLIRIIMGLIRPRSGQARLFGQSVTARDHIPDVGFVGELPQSDGATPLPPGLRVESVIRTAEGLLDGDRELPPDIEEIRRILALDALKAKCVGELSTGQRKRLMTYLAFRKHPRLLLFDEPTDGLDDKACEAVLGLIKRVAHSGRTAVLIASHDSLELAEVCDRDCDRVYELDPSNKTLREVGQRGFDCHAKIDGVDKTYRCVPAKGLFRIVADAAIKQAASRIELKAEAQDLPGATSS